MNDTPTPTPPSPVPLMPRKAMDDLPEEMESSGKSTAAFAREKGLPAWKLYNALNSRGKRASKTKCPGLIPVRVVNRPVERHEPIELALSSGHRLIIPANYDELQLRRLMGTLAGC